jgi:hypothetical protein
MHDVMGLGMPCKWLVHWTNPTTVLPSATAVLATGARLTALIGVRRRERRLTAVSRGSRQVA